MNIFVATQKTQGEKPTDYCFVPEGEIVVFPFKTHEKEKDFNICLIGIESKKSTTTFMVKRLDISKEELVEKLKKFFIESGATSRSFEAEEWSNTYAERLITYAGRFPVGAVVGKKSRWTYYERDNNSQ